MLELKYSIQAQKDLISTHRFISENSGSIEVASRFTSRLRDQCQQLATLPGTLGRSREEIAAGIRSFPFGNYVIFIRYEQHELNIVSIIEGHRDIDSFIGIL
jgi:toxin ParE1/3/4